MMQRCSPAGSAARAQLIHWVASVPGGRQPCRAVGTIERGAIITASRPTPNGLLRWQITVRETACA